MGHNEWCDTCDTGQPMLVSEYCVHCNLQTMPQQCFSIASLIAAMLNCKRKASAIEASIAWEWNVFKSNICLFMIIYRGKHNI